MKKHSETQRFILRPFEESDAQGLYELDSDPEVHKYLGNKPIKSINEAKSTVKYIQNQYEEYGIGRWAIIDKISKEFVGWSGLKFETMVRTDMDYYDLGYRLKKKFWGKGIATETSQAALKLGFSILQLDKIYGGAHVDNFASNLVLKKLGFKCLETFEYDGAPHYWYFIDRDHWVVTHNQ